MFWNRRAPALIDETGLTEEQKILANLARRTDTAAMWDGDMPVSQMTLQAKWDEADRKEAERDARILATGGTLDPVRMERQKRYGLDVPLTTDNPSPLNQNQMAIGNMAEAAAPPAAQDFLDPGGDITPLNPAQRVLANGYPSPAYLRQLAARGVDVSSIAPQWEGQNIYDESTGRERRAYVDKMDPTNVTNVGGVKAADPTKLEFREAGRNGGRVTVALDPATGQEVRTIGDVIYPEPDKPKEPTVAGVIAPIVQKMAQGLPLTPSEQKALEYYKAVDPMNQMIARLMGGGGNGPVAEQPSAPPAAKGGLPPGYKELAPGPDGKRRVQGPDGRIQVEK